MYWKVDEAISSPLSTWMAVTCLYVWKELLGASII